VPRGERFNVCTHLLGALLTVAGMLVLVAPPVARGETKKALGFAIYGLTLFLAYVASTLYHCTRGETRDLLRRYDRITIYLVIAGTYTPVALLKLPPAWGGLLLVVVWALASAGSVAELRLGGRRPPSVALYLLMGWMSVVALGPLVDALSWSGVAWLGVGGVFYTLGAINLRFDLVPRSHEVWHVLVLAGSGCHFAVMLLFVS
jgi:hemolysin III